MDYIIIRSARQTISLQIMADGSMVVRSPLKMREEEIRRFVESKQRWIRKHLPQQDSRVNRLTQGEKQALAERAKKEIPVRVAYYARLLGVTYGKITVRKQRTCWGSCSGKGNLNFNCLLMLAPENVLDYVVVHELCHRKQMNHSQSFWAAVERMLPDYKAAKKWLKDNGNQLISKL